MINSTRPHYTWTSSSTGRGKRRHPVGAGCYVIEHVSTGRFICGTSSQVSEQVDKELQSLRSGKHPSKLFRKLFDMDDELSIYEFPVKETKLAKAEITSIRKLADPQYLSVEK